MTDQDDVISPVPSLEVGPPSIRKSALPNKPPPRPPAPVSSAPELGEARAARAGGLRRRADWLEREAHRKRPPALRGRLLLAASELRALLGEIRRARRLAQQALECNPTSTLALRQVRLLAGVQGDRQAQLRTLRKEADDPSASSKLRAHAHYVIGELLRSQGSGGEAASSYENAELADPRDPRPQLQRLVRQLASSNAAPEQTWGSGERLAPLREATRQIQVLRGGGGTPPKARETLASLLVDLSGAFARKDDAALAKLLTQLDEDPNLAEASRWLRFVFAGKVDEQGPQAAELATELASRAGPLPLRLAAARALGRGDLEALRALTASEGFPEEDRAPLEMLAGIEAPDADPAGSAPHHGSKAERMAVSAPEAPASPLHQSFQMAEVALHEPLRALVQRLPPATPTEGLLVRLWGAAAAEDRTAIAQVLAQLEAGDPARSAENRFLASAFHLAEGRGSEATEHLRAGLHSPLCREAATRRLIELEEPSEAGLRLRALSIHCEADERRGLLLTEALHRMAPTDSGYDALAKEAARFAPAMPLAALLGELAARAKGDLDRALEWLDQQKQQSDGEAAGRLASIRRLQLDASRRDRGAEPEQAATLALVRSFHGEDLATQEWLQQQLDVPPDEVAKSRLIAASRCSGPFSSALKAEAAAWYEQARSQEKALAAVAADPDAVCSALWRSFAELLQPEALITHLGAQHERQPSKQLARDIAAICSRLGDHEGAAQWLRQAVSEADASVEELRAFQRANLVPGGEKGLMRASIALCHSLEGEDRIAHAHLLCRLTIDAGHWRETVALEDWLGPDLPRPQWAVRLLLAHAQLAYSPGQTDARAMLGHYAVLLQGEHNSIDEATLRLHVAELLDDLGNAPEAFEQSARAVELVPESTAALRIHSRLLRSAGQHLAAAQTLADLGERCQCARNQAEVLSEAATLWMDTLGNRQEGIELLVRAVLADPDYEPPMARLAPIYLEGGDYQALLDVASQCLDQATSAIARANLDLIRAQALTRLGQFEAALEVLSDLRARSAPDDEQIALDAMNLQAAVLHAKGDSEGADKTWKAVLATESSTEQRLVALRGLASPGMTKDDTERAAIYEEILKHDPTDQVARRRLIRLHLTAGNSERAVDLQRDLVDHSVADADRLEALLELAELHALSPAGEPHAEELLSQAARTWPEDPRVLRAQVEHYRKTNRPDSAQVVVDRTAHSVRAAIAAGRIEAGLFRSLEVACRLQGSPPAARAAQAALAALHGRSLKMPGLGTACGSPQLDAITAPPLLSPGFRALLMSVGDSLEQAHATQTVGASPLGGRQTTEVQSIAREFGLSDVRVVASERLGFDCVPVRTDKLTLVFGKALLEHPNVRTRDFMLLRALKIAQVKGAALCRLPPNEVSATVAGLFACFIAPPQAEGADAQRLLAARDRIGVHLKVPIDPELEPMLPALAANVLPLAMSIGDAIRHWACRTALLGVGEISPALQALWSLARPGVGLPNTLEQRIRWTAENDQASDLLSFSVGKAFVAASRPSPPGQRAPTAPHAPLPPVASGAGAPASTAADLPPRQR